jgi:hypothetical protein
VAHACNPSYSGGSDQEDEVFWDPSSKKTYCKKKRLVEWFKVNEGPKLKPQYCKTKKENNVRWSAQLSDCPVNYSAIKQRNQASGSIYLSHVNLVSAILSLE